MVRLGPVTYCRPEPPCVVTDIPKCGSSFPRLSVKALAGPCRTEPTITPEVGIRRITVFDTGFYH